VKRPIYPNLIRGFQPVGINELWVCDITYIWTLSGFCFLSLITDAYSHMIIGYTLAPKLEFHYTESALDMALATIPEHPDGLIHHSDRGIQYATIHLFLSANKYLFKHSYKTYYAEWILCMAPFCWSTAVGQLTDGRQPINRQLSAN
jgi:transposase InsO family protein